MKRFLAAVVLGLSLAGMAHAAIDTYEFAKEGDRERFRELTKELRCPKCQNQNIADSNAPIAADLRREIFRMLGEGVRVYYLTGNHDELLRRYSGLTLGGLQLEDKLVLELDGKKHWFFHGDVFDVTMRGSKWLAKLGTLGYELLIITNQIVNFLLELFGRDKISLSKMVKESVKKGVKKMGNYELTAAEIAIENKYDYVLNGHIHIPVIKNIETPDGKVTYLNSGDWVENMTALEYAKGEWKLVWYKDLTFPENWLHVEEGDLP